MSNYAIEFTKSVQKELNQLQPQTNLLMAQAIDELSANPRKGNVRPMVGVSSRRLRVGDYRVIYDILDIKLIVLIIKSVSEETFIDSALSSKMAHRSLSNQKLG